MNVVSNFQPIAQQHDELLASLRQIRRKEPIFFWPEHDIWVVTRYEDATTVLSDAEHFTNEGNLSVLNNKYCAEAQAILASGVDWTTTPQINDTEGETHRRLRGVMQNILTPKRIREMAPTIRAIVNKLIDGFIDDRECDFVAQFSYPLPVHVIFELIGFKAEEENLPQLQEWSDNMFRLWLVPMPPEEQAKCAAQAVQFQNYIKAKIADRRINPCNDLMTDFVRQLDIGDGRLTEDELTIMFPNNLIGAGHETTKSALTNALYHMLSVPERWQAIVDDPTSIPATVEETLRWDGSVFAWYRTVAKRIEIGDKILEAGDKIAIALGSANHDETRFEDPENFCPARNNRPGQITFSTGRHFCPGAPLARLELAIALEELSRRLPGLHLAKPGPADLDQSFATRVIKTLPLRWSAAKSQS